MGGLINSIGSMLGFGPNSAAYQAGGQPFLNQLQQQAGTAYGQTQQGLGQQQDLINALNAQNGIQNQSNVYNQLQGIASGQGPINPAQAMLNQATGQNIANQAALMAGQRGAAANPALIARQAAQQGGNLQQQAAGQGATLQAQQALGALGQAGGLANQQAANQLGATQAYNQLAQNQMGQLIGGANQLQGNINQVNQAQAAQNAANQAKGIGGLFNSLGSIGNLFGGGGGTAAAAAPGTAATGAGGTFGLGGADFISGLGSNLASLGTAALGVAKGGEIQNPKLAAVSPQHRYPSHIGHVAAIYHGNKYNDPHQEHKISRAENKYAYGANVGDQLKQGGKVPGKAMYNGDTTKNDTVKAKLSPGEVVIPRSIMQSENPADGAAQFVDAIQKKKGMSTNHEEDFRGALKREIGKRRKK